MNVLIADDDPITLRLLETQLVKWGYQVITAQNGIEAWEKIQSRKAEIVVSDWLMPELDGIELCKRIRANSTPHYIYLIMISTQDTREDIVRGLDAGVDDYITKPINLEEMRSRLRIGERIVGLETELSRKYKNSIEKSYYDTIRIFVHLIEAYDEDLGSHSRRVGATALDLARHHPDVVPVDYPLVEVAGLVHDIGMVGLPGEVLTKKRTEMKGNEQQLFQSHPARGEMILRDIDMLKTVSLVVRTHHEQYNGKGFPDGIKGPEIPLFSQLVSAASIYDNMVHRGHVKLEDIPQHFQRIRGYHLDPEIADLVLMLNAENIEKEVRKSEVVMELNDLHNGMRLSRDVKMKTGAIVLTAHTELTSHEIGKLKGYAEMSAIIPKVYVHKHSVKGI